MSSLEDQWERVVSLLGNDKFPEFLRMFWNNRNNLVRKSELFKTIRKDIIDQKSAFELLRSLVEYAEIFSDLRDSPDSSDENKIEARQKYMAKATLNIRHINFAWGGRGLAIEGARSGRQL